MEKNVKKIIAISEPSITQKEIDYVTDAVTSGWVSSLGKYINLFEEGFANYCGTKYAVSTSNGTTGLHLSLVALGITAQDEVIVPDLTFIATANAVKYIGAKVVVVDIDEDTLCMNPIALEAAITDRTKAIIPVHLYGHPADMIEINRIAEKYHLFVIEDAAEAHGAEINGRRVGSFGDLGVFSFYGNKIMTSGEGGMITTNDINLYERLKYLRDHAMSMEKRYWHTEIGYNYRMTNLQAALGLAQLERIDELTLKKREIFNWYYENLKDTPQVKLNFEKKNVKNAFWLPCIELLGYSEKNRDLLLVNLKEIGIDGRPYFYPISDMPMFEDVETKIAHLVSHRGISLPSHFNLDKNNVDFICSELKKLL